MFKNQLQELAQRSCFNLPSYASIREGPDHAPRFKASVNFNGEIFESPCYCPTLRQAEHSAAQLALNVLSSRGSKSLNARVLDETGVYKSLLQETTHKAGLNLPVYTTIRSGPGHAPVFTCTVELAGMTFTGDSAKTKKQAEKYAAISAWFSLKKMPSLVPKKATDNQNEEQEQEQDQVIVTRFLSNFKPKTGEKPSKEYQRRPRNSRYWRSSQSLNSSHKHKQAWSENLEIQLKELDAHNVEKTSFVDLLPPPPPRTKSKILPLTSKVGVVSKEQEHDPSKLRHTHQNLGQPHLENMLLRPCTMSNALKTMPLSCAQMGFKGVNHVINPRGVAPAVQIRSIIPVCASPSSFPSSSTLSSSLSRNQPLPLNPNYTDQLNSGVTKLVLKEG